jgi:Ser/Thr protein kinase RdoA (MazF antagonist)
MNKALSVEYSVVSAASLQQQLHLIYEFPSGSTVSFLNQGMHDVYLISNGAIHLILKIFRKGWKSHENVKAELDLLLELKQRNVDVSVPYKDREGQYIQELQYPEGIRYGVVYMYAPGSGVKALDEETARLFGRKLASLHAATAGMENTALQPGYYLGNIFDSALENISSMITELRVVESLRKLYFSMDSFFDTLDTGELKTGMCHGDAHYDNAHFQLQSGRVTFYDFDLCGNGYLLYDVAGFCYSEREKPAITQAFLEGYSEVLPLSDTERKLIPFFIALMRIFHLGMRVRNANGSQNPLWPKQEVMKQLQEIEKEVAEFRS